MIISHESPEYRRRWDRAGMNKYNGAYYYSREIVRNIIPRVETDRNWITINQKPLVKDHSVFFVHNNLHPEHYNWLAWVDDIVLVCGIPSTCEKVKKLGRPIYLPLSIDVEEVRQHARPKTKGRAFAGRKAKRKGIVISDADILEGMPRPALLDAMAEYEEVYAVGRTALEAKALGCEILPYDPRFPDPSVWNVIDNSEAAQILQLQLDQIDRRHR